MGISFKVEGLAKAQIYLKLKNKQADVIIGNAMNNVALFVEDEVKQSIAGRKAEPASVDTGRFLNSVDSKSNKESATIFSDLNYSQFLEYGTSRIPERRHFRNSLSRNKSKITASIQAALRKL